MLATPTGPHTGGNGLAIITYPDAPGSVPIGVAAGCSKKLLWASPTEVWYARTPPVGFTHGTMLKPVAPVGALSRTCMAMVTRLPLKGLWIGV